MRTGKELILATRPFAADSTAKSWWCILSTAFLLAGCIVGTLPHVAGIHFPLAGRIACSVLTGLLLLRLFV
ncbi:MAG TPA: fatty acid desaturase, partial [Verrucomicrobiae bacterium]|nr:fatty acid desaturase [Verrucomicrobiae bacterium]